MTPPRTGRRGEQGEPLPPGERLQMRQRPSLTHAHVLAVDQKRLRRRRATTEQ